MAESSSGPMLEVRGLEVRYGRVPAVRGVDLEVGGGEIVGLIGPNGAGKSSTLHAIMGAAPVVGGAVSYGLPHETNSWNPALAQWGSYSMTEARALFDFLTTFDSQGNIKPYLAESLDHNGDFTTWTIKLRSGVTFTNGKAFDANTLLRKKDGRMTSEKHEVQPYIVPIADAEKDLYDKQRIRAIA